MVELIEKDLENIESNMIIKDSDENTECIEITYHEELARHRHVWNIEVDRAVSTTDGERNRGRK